MWSKRTVIERFVCVIAIFLLADTTGAKEIDKTWQWHEEGYEIFQPAFSPNNNLVFVRKLHEPDGHEAEMYSEKELHKYEERQKQNDRFADPEVVLLNTQSKNIKRIDWGWTPDFSPNGNEVVYAYQQRPISGYRVLAETLAGNEIHVFNTLTNKKSVLAKPENGYLSNPHYSGNDEVVYSYSDAVNGAYGGDVGIGKVNTITSKTEVLYKPQREHDLYHLIDSIKTDKDRILFIRKKPTSSGIYLAENYFYELIQISKDGKVSVLYDWGKHKFFDRFKPAYKVDMSGGIQIYDGKWKPISINKSNDSSMADYGVVSPNGEYIAISLETGISIKRFSDSKSIKIWKSQGQLESVTWSKDSRKVILVVTKYKGSSEIFAYDELIILEI